MCLDGAKQAGAERMVSQGRKEKTLFVVVVALFFKSLTVGGETRMFVKSEA